MYRRFPQGDRIFTAAASRMFSSRRKYSVDGENIPSWNSALINTEVMLVITECNHQRKHVTFPNIYEGPSGRPRGRSATPSQGALGNIRGARGPTPGGGARGPPQGAIGNIPPRGRLGTSPPGGARGPPPRGRSGTPRALGKSLPTTQKSMESVQVRPVHPHTSAAISSASIALAYAQTHPDPSTRLSCADVRRPFDARSPAPRPAQFFPRGDFSRGVN